METKLNSIQRNRLIQIEARIFFIKSLREDALKQYGNITKIPDSVMKELFIGEISKLERERYELLFGKKKFIYVNYIY